MHGRGMFRKFMGICAENILFQKLSPKCVQKKLAQTGQTACYGHELQVTSLQMGGIKLKTESITLSYSPSSILLYCRNSQV